MQTETAEGNAQALGAWATDASAIEALAREFSGAKPFPSAVIEGFLAPELAEACRRDFPPHTDPDWHLYCNPIEVKLANNASHTWRSEHLRRVIGPRVLQSPGFLELLRRITGIEELENDPHLHGGGLHCHPPGGKLDMHLDYSIHPLSGKERRLNLIMYLVDDAWSEEADGGDLQLWNADMSACERRIFPAFNRAVLFRTTEISWHGMPDPVRGLLERKSMAIYYVSEPRPDAAHRHKAGFTRRPHDPPDEELDRLRATRVQRRLEPSDMSRATRLKYASPPWSPRQR